MIYIYIYTKRKEEVIHWVQKQRKKKEDKN